jgi:hypothetical protein
MFCLTFLPKPRPSNGVWCRWDIEGNIIEAKRYKDGEQVK